MSNSCYGVPLSNGDRRSPWKLSCMFSQALKNLWKISENLWLHFVPLIYSDSLWFTLNIQGYSWTKAFGPSSETTMSRQQKAKKEQKRTKCTNRRTSNRTFRFTRRTNLWEFRCSVFTVPQLSFSVKTFWLNWHVFHVFHVHSRSQTLKNVTHVVTCTVDFLIVCGHGFPFSIFHFRHVELQPCHTMCISLQGTTAVRRQKHHRLEHRLPWFRRCDPQVRSDLPCQLQMVLHALTPPRRPPGPRSVVLEGAQKIGRPPAAPSSLRPLQPPPLRSRSSRSRRPRQTRSRSDSRARSRSPGPSVSEVRSEARSLQQAHHTYPPGIVVLRIHLWVRL